MKINIPLFNAVQGDPATATFIYHVVGIGAHISALIQSGIPEDEIRRNVDLAISKSKLIQS